MDTYRHFPHPCKVRKVVSRDGKHVVTLGEDSILRIWDQTIRPMSADVSAYSGKVTAQSDESMQMMQSVIDNFKDQFGPEALKSDALLATKDVGNYWTKNIDTPVESELRNQYITFGNARYLVVAHNTTSIEGNLTYTHSFTVWDLSTMQCMRRTFLRRSRIKLLAGTGGNDILFASVTNERPPQAPILYKVDLTDFETKPVTDRVNPFHWDTLTVLKDLNGNILELS